MGASRAWKQFLQAFEEASDSSRQPATAKIINIFHVLSASSLQLWKILFSHISWRKNERKYWTVGSVHNDSNRKQIESAIWELERSYKTFKTIKIRKNDWWFSVFVSKILSQFGDADLKIVTPLIRAIFGSKSAHRWRTWCCKTTNTIIPYPTSIDENAELFQYHALFSAPSTAILEYFNIWPFHAIEVPQPPH